jgi:hypothetical protein
MDTRAITKRMCQDEYDRAVSNWVRCLVSGDEAGFFHWEAQASAAKLLLDDFEKEEQCQRQRK